MATGIIVPGRRLVTQPQYLAPIDFAGLGKGVQVLFNPAFGPVDVVTGRVWAPNGTPYISASPLGKVLGFDGGSSDDAYTYTGYPEITGNAGTFFMWAPTVGAADTFGHIFLSNSTSSANYFQVANDNTIYAFAVQSTGTISWFNSTNRSLVMSSGGAAATVKAYLDGLVTGLTWSAAPTSWASGSKDMSIGRYSGGVAWDFAGTMLAVGYTTQVWGAAEARAFHDSKGLALYKAPARRLWVSVAAGGTTYNQGIAGSLTPAGAITKQTGKSLSGSSTAAGSLTKQTGKSLSGSSTAAGALSRSIAKSIAGSITYTGNIVKQTAKSFAGSITGSGALSTMILFTASVAGSITATGAIAKMTLKALTGSSTLSGAITKLTSKGLSASITLSGTLNKLTTKAFAGATTVTGSLVEHYQVVKSIAGSITPTGAVTTVYTAFVAGVRKLLALMGVGQ